MDDVLKALQALSDPTRFAVFNCIRGCGGASGYDPSTGYCDAGETGAVSVCDVKCQVPCAPSTLTHHLNALREAGLITTEKRGRNVYATVVAERLEQIGRYFGPAAMLIECCETQRKEKNHEQLQELPVLQML